MTCRAHPIGLPSATQQQLYTILFSLSPMNIYTHARYAYFSRKTILARAREFFFIVDFSASIALFFPLIIRNCLCCSIDTRPIFRLIVRIRAHPSPRVLSGEIKKKKKKKYMRTLSLQLNKSSAYNSHQVRNPCGWCVLLQLLRNTHTQRVYIIQSISKRSRRYNCPVKPIYLADKTRGIYGIRVRNFNRGNLPETVTKYSWKK